MIVVVIVFFGLVSLHFVFFSSRECEFVSVCWLCVDGVERFRCCEK